MARRARSSLPGTARLAALVVLLVLVSVNGQTLRAATSDEQGLELFEQRIRPALAKHCYECHATGAKEIKGGLRLDDREALRTGGDSGPAVVPGKPDESLIIEVLHYADDSTQMPPTGKLPESLIADFETWVRLGAPDPRTAGAVVAKPASTIDIDAGRKFWAFQPVRMPAVPLVGDAWPRTDIDRFVMARLKERGLRPVADAARRTLLRRATFDLTGLPPTVEELEAFLADERPDAFERVVDRLLAAPEFGERWARHWLDVARYADSNGVGMNFSYDTAWRYRDYVIDSLNRDKPYDEFVREQIAGDLLPAADDATKAQHLVATVFLMLGPKEMAAYDKPALQLDVINEQVDTIGRAFLGLTVGCARCHDHKFDPIPTADYYALTGIFKSTTTLKGTWGNNNLYSGWLVRPLPIPAEPGQAEAVALYDQTKKETRKRLRAFQAQVKRLTEEAEKLAAFGPSAGADLAALEHKLGEAKAQRGYITIADEALPELAPAPLPEVMAVADDPMPQDSPIHIRGEVNNVGPVVPRGVLKVATFGAPPSIDPKQSGRLELANWIASPSNPLTARVMVNRVWSHLLEEGIVRSVDNFGARGERPSHPELLDYLAARFVDDGWSIKRLIREIVLSRVYQTSSAHDAKAGAVDPENRLLWRWNRHRLDVDAIRDAMLATSGRLDRARGGPTLEYSGMLFATTYYRRLSLVAAPWKRRSVYVPVLRDGHAEQVDIFEVFDFPNPNMVTGKRGVTTVPTQGLYLMNSPWVVQQAEALAGRMFASPGGETDALERLHLVTLGRKPRADEQALVQAFIESYARAAIAEQPTLAVADARSKAWASYCQGLLTSNEFLFLD